MSDTSRHPMHDLVEEYVLDLLDPVERGAFEARVAVDPALARAVTEAREALTSVAMSTPVLPPPDLKARVMATAVARPAEETPAETAVIPFPTSRRSTAPLWLGAALAASLVVIVKLASDLKNERNATAAALASSTRLLDAVSNRDSIIARLTTPDIELVTLASTGAAKPSIKAYVDTKRGRLVLAVTALPTLEAGKEYQLWYIETGKAPMPSVAFQTDSSGRALLTDVPLPAGAWDVAAITVERAGGSPVPTTAPILAGQRASR